jgi:hypothetical protein
LSEWDTFKPLVGLLRRYDDTLVLEGAGIDVTSTAVGSVTAADGSVLTLRDLLCCNGSMRSAIHGHFGDVRRRGLGGAFWDRFDSDVRVAAPWPFSVVGIE